MKDVHGAISPESAVALERDLQIELKNWYDLLQRFYGYHDDELEFDVDAAGEEGSDYLRMLEELQEDSARSISRIKSRASSPEATETSLHELRRISAKVRKTLRVRERLRTIGTQRLGEMILYCH